MAYLGVCAVCGKNGLSVRPDQTVEEHLDQRNNKPCDGRKKNPANSAELAIQGVNSMPPCDAQPSPGGEPF